MLVLVSVLKEKGMFACGRTAMGLSHAPNGSQADDKVKKKMMDAALPGVLISFR